MTKVIWVFRQEWVIILRTVRGGKEGIIYYLGFFFYWPSFHSLTSGHEEHVFLFPQILTGKYLRSGGKAGHEESSDTGEFGAWWAKQRELQNRIEKTCEKYGASLHRSIQRKQLMYDPRHDLLFCRNAKVCKNSITFYLYFPLILQVGTTTWLTHFLHLSTLSESKKNETMSSSQKLHRIVPPLFPVPEEYQDFRLRYNWVSSYDFNTFLKISC